MYRTWWWVVFATACGEGTEGGDARVDSVEFDGVEVHATEVEVDATEVEGNAPEVDAEGPSDVALDGAAELADPVLISTMFAHSGTITVDWPMPELVRFGVDPTTWIFAAPWSGPVVSHVRVETVGACSAWTFAATLCDPPCSNFEACDATSRCVPQPEAIDVGAITVSGGADVATLTPSTSPFGVWYDNHSAIGTFGGGAPVKIAVAGGPDGGDAFERTLPFVTAPDFGPAQTEYGIVELPFSEAAPIVLSWTPDPSPGLEVGLLVFSGHHGSSPTRIIHCAASDADGTLTLAPEIVAWFDPVYEGNNHEHFAYRRAVEWVTTKRGGIELRTQVTRSIRLL